VTLFLGLDGGGTKTAVVLVDADDHDGMVLARWRGSGCSWLDDGVDAVAAVVGEGTRRVLAAAGRSADEVAHAFYGLPGHGESATADVLLDALPHDALRHLRYTVGNDMLAGWAGSLGGRDGINVVAGTGSITYGERGTRTHRVGGWSELIGDEGSAHWVARRGLNAFSRMADGRLPRTALYGLVRDHTGITEDLDLVGLLMQDLQAERAAVAAFSRVVTAAAAAGDPVAAAVLDDAVDELV
jgi:N-acetylglucosamine kinase-like BadF-type ATPase